MIVQPLLLGKDGSHGVAAEAYGTGFPYAPENCRNRMMFGDGELDGELFLSTFRTGICIC